MGEVIERKDIMSAMLPSIILFALTYVLIFGKFRPYIALGSGRIFILTGMLPLDII